MFASSLFDTGLAFKKCLTKPAERQEKDTEEKGKFQIIYSMFGFEVKVVNSLVFLQGREVKGNKKKQGEKMRTGEEKFI